MKKILLAIIFSIFFYQFCFAYPTDFHYDLNKNVLLLSLTQNYLIENLNIDGEGELFNGKSLLEWIRTGGREEDTPPRWLRHFHDPVAPSWTQAGYKGMFQSSILWAQNPDQGLFGSYSWANARENFYNALTVTASNSNRREEYYADAFKSIGCVMHLVEDASVPAHVRDDTHVFGYNFEEWIKEYKVRPDQYSSYSFDKSILSDTPNGLAPIPIAKIFDRDIYTGNNMEDAVGNAIGLAEYTNANFFSEGTANDYPRPALSDLALNPDNSQYYKKVNGEMIDHFAAVSYMSFIDRLFSRYEFTQYYGKEIYLDEVCYTDYAAKLIPRAIGYSTGLLDYFFRGQPEAVEPHENGTGISMKVRNNTQPNNEHMINGKLLVAYRYKPSGSSEFTYGISEPIENVTINSGVESNQFNFLMGAIPGDAEDKEFLLVYRGKLGSEGDAVAAKKFVLPPPPPPGTSYVATYRADTVYLYDGTWNGMRTIIAPEYCGGSNVSSISTPVLPSGDLVGDGSGFECACAQMTAIQQAHDGPGICNSMITTVENSCTLDEVYTSGGQIIHLYSDAPTGFSDPSYIVGNNFPDKILIPEINAPPYHMNSQCDFTIPRYYRLLSVEQR